MPQLQLPIFPVGTTLITSEIAFECRDGKVIYVNGHLPVFQHEEKDLASFRLFTSQLIINGTVGQAEIARAFHVPLGTVKRYVRRYRDGGAKRFFTPPNRRSAAVLKGEVKERVQILLDEGNSVAEVARTVDVLADTLHKAIGDGRLHRPKKKDNPVAEASQIESSTKSARSEEDSTAAMGYATTRPAERVAASIGALASAPIQFEAACDVPKGGVLLALPALLSAGLLRHTTELYTLPNGFYGIASIFLLLALMALARIKSIEQLRYVAPGEWGNLLGLDRIPEVRTLRGKLEILCRQAGRAVLWNTALAKEWIAGQRESEMIFYIDGHVRVYSGDLTPLPRHYVARQRLCLRATTDYWINAMDGQPFLLVNKEVDPGLVATLRSDLVPWLKTNAPASEELGKRMQEDALQHWFTLVFDREGYSPELFAEMKQERIAMLTYHKFPGEKWSAEEFTDCGVRLAGGEVVTMKLAERGTMLSNRLWVREVRKLSEGGHQTSILSTNYRAGYTVLAASMFARWSQENFFKYMRQHYSLDRLAEYGIEPVPDPIQTVNPAWRKLDSQIRTEGEKRRRQLAVFGALGLQPVPTDSDVSSYQLRKAHLQEQVENLNRDIDQLKLQRNQTLHHIAVKDLPESDRFSRLLTERKHFIDTIKLLAYRAESSMASLLRDKLNRTDDARALLRQIYDTEADLIPDLQTKTLTVRLHHLTQSAHDQAVRHLCDELNATETIFPDTDLKLVFQLGSSQIP